MKIGNFGRGVAGKFRSYATGHPIRSAVYVLVLIGVLLGTIGVLGHFLCWGLDWGNIATWFSAVASAMVAITLALLTYSRGEREKQLAAELDANRVQLWIYPSRGGSIGTDGSAWTFDIHNGSSKPIHRLTFESVTAVPAGDGAIVYALEKTGIWLDARRGHAVSYTLAAGEQHRFDFKPGDTALVQTHHAAARAHFVDADGRKFRLAYYRDQSPGTPLASRWIYDGQATRVGTDDLIVP
ncbi:hypothetical protein [Nocardia sp. NPDC051463]|uniref:hypothetical protein n=1 Tax=Nocardia sp. NPDC051463 TaxID=3154845 RepID=UPI00344F0FDD